MKIEVQCFGAMREFLPPAAVGNHVSMEVADGARVADAVAALGAPEGLVHAVLVNEEPSGLTQELEDGDRLTLMPHYSGGGARRAHG